MNKKGFTLVEVLAVMIILGLLMLLVVPSINKMMNNTDKQKYETYERMIEEYAVVYPDKSLTVIKLSQFDNLKKEIMDKAGCIGYVTVDRSTNYYEAYICCGEECKDYKTNDFDETKAG